MNLLIASNTNLGGAILSLSDTAICLSSVPELKLYYLSKKALVQIGVCDQVIESNEFSETFAKLHGMTICDSIDMLDADTILMEENFSSLWDSPYTIGSLAKFKRKITNNRISWINPIYSYDISKFIKNYLCSFLTEDMRHLIKNFTGFSNVFERLMFIDFDNIRGGVYTPDYKYDLCSSYRPSSKKVSSTLAKEIDDLCDLYSVKYVIVSEANGPTRKNVEFMKNYREYLSFLKNGVRGYLHFQDRWVETFGRSLYEAIKICDFVIYKPEPYCDIMLSYLNADDLKNVFVAKNLADLSKILFHFGKNGFPVRRCPSSPDLFNNDSLYKGRLLRFLDNLHY